MKIVISYFEFFRCICAYISNAVTVAFSDFYRFTGEVRVIITFRSKISS